LRHRAQTLNNLATQLDIYPTIMGLLNISYINNTFGTDILHEKQPYVFFNSDDVAGCLSEEYYLVMQKNDREFLYRYKQTDITDYRAIQNVTADSMSVYARSMYQTAQWMIKHRKVGNPSLPQDR
jgi:phosphoglycerol transferase MdoB-like AlkP superfamily enzyme